MSDLSIGVERALGGHAVLEVHRSDAPYPIRQAIREISGENATRHTSFSCMAQTILMSTLVLFLVLGGTCSGVETALALETETATKSATEMEAGRRRLSHGGEWFYVGEVKVWDGKDGGYYCSEGYCSNGFGTLVNSSGLTFYTGTLADGEMHGHGTYSGSYFDYVGHFERGRIEGHGILTCPSGYRFEGTFVRGRMTGQFKTSTPDGREIIGPGNKEIYSRDGTICGP